MQIKTVKSVVFTACRLEKAVGFVSLFSVFSII